MPTLELTDEQIVELFRQLPPDRRSEVRRVLAEQTESWLALSSHVQPRIRQAAAERGQDWDAMSREQQETFIDDLLHED